MQDTQAALFSVGEKILPVELGADFAQRFGFYSWNVGAAYAQRLCRLQLRQLRAALQAETHDKYGILPFWKALLHDFV